MVRALARVALTLVLLASLTGLVWTARDVLRTPALQPLVARSAEGIRAASNLMMAAEATPENVTARLRTLLAETPRNWLAIAAVEGVAERRAIALPADLAAARQAAWDEDHSWSATAGKCAACAIDAASCELSAVLICQAPMVLTPLGDIAGVGSESWHYLTGAQVDRLNLGLSLAGLGATALVLVSGGSSVSVKLGAGTLRLAHRMGLVSERLGRFVLHSVEAGIDWARLPAARGRDDLIALVDPRVLRPLAETLDDLGRIGARLSPTETLHLLRYIDGPADARRMARASEALGERTVGRLELLGKSRFLRATLRFSAHALGLIAGLFGLIWAGGTLIAHALGHAALRRQRRWARARQRT
ncbi:hypothetical protein [Acidimangrovimonas pyrenivorans]|uniref:Uncharacterized protein n=1 Tax=Acidimangrovimonas pyrenivorans TaxID=2030798 RepID=A0ABV7AIT1_9RHOB